MTLCCIIYILLIAHTSSYWLSQNRLSWLDARAYCQSRCNSTLASFHNIDDISTAKYLLLNESIIKSGFDNTDSAQYRVWIGLNKIFTSNWVWSNGSSVDSNFIQNIPWNDGEPSGGSAELCVHYKLDDEAFNDRDCDSQYRFLCNSCENVLDKYILYSTPSHYLSALNSCVTDLDTSLASIHNEDDYNSIILLAELDGAFRHWIGLDEDNDDAVYKWRDETYLDFDNLPWKNGEPNNDDQQCTQLDATADGKETGLEDSRCDETWHYICNKPNEFCNNESWDILDNSDGMTFEGCELTINGDGINVVSDKRWNENKVKIEYVFQIEGIDISETYGTGIMIFYTEESDVSDYTFIGILYENNQIYFKINTLQTYKRYKGMISVDSSRYHQLNIDLISDEGQLTILPQIDGIDIKAFYLHGDVFTSVIKYIGIRNINANTIGKSLFISGTAQYFTNFTNSISFFSDVITTTMKPILTTLTKTTAAEGTITTIFDSLSISTHRFDFSTSLYVISIDHFIPRNDGNLLKITVLIFILTILLCLFMLLLCCCLRQKKSRNAVKMQRDTAVLSVMSRGEGVIKANKEWRESADNRLSLAMFGEDQDIIEEEDIEDKELIEEIDSFDEVTAGYLDASISATGIKQSGSFLHEASKLNKAQKHAIEVNTFSLSDHQVAAQGVVRENGGNKTKVNRNDSEELFIVMKKESTVSRGATILDAYVERFGEPPRTAVQLMKFSKHNAKFETLSFKKAKEMFSTISDTKSEKK